MGKGKPVMEEKVVYFEMPGRDNTNDVLRLVKERAEARKINKIVLASTTGETARLAATMFAETGISLIVVAHQFGFDQTQKFPQELVRELEGKGLRMHFGTMLFHTEDFYGINVPRAMANLLRIFGEGTKVCIEIILMAADAGLVEAGEEVIAIAGTGRGADTAIVARAASSRRLRNLHVAEIICKPL